MALVTRSGHRPLASEWLAVQGALDNVEIKDALNITAAAPFVSGLGAGSATTEISSKLRLTVASIEAGVEYEFSGSWLMVGSALGSDWICYIRQGSASGTIIGTFYLPNIGTNAQTITWKVLHKPASAASNVTFYFTYSRNGGAQTFSLYNTIGGGQCLFSQVAATGPSANYRSVA